MSNKIKETSFRRKNLKISSYRDALEQMLERDLSKIRNKRVLEIGCGTWGFAKKILEKNSCEWIGLEPVDFKNNNLTIFKGSVKSLPFHDSSFDLVLCNQTIEHWFEYNVSFRRAFGEISRVLKPKGILMVNTGVHIHGHPYFLRGDLKRISRIFHKKLWKITLFEKISPSEKLKRWKQLGSRGWQSRAGYPDFLIPNSKNAFSYLLNIHAMNIKKPKKDDSNFYYYYTRPIIVIIRFFKELIFSY